MLLRNVLLSRDAPRGRCCCHFCRRAKNSAGNVASCAELLKKIWRLSETKEASQTEVFSLIFVPEEKR